MVDPFSRKRVLVCLLLGMLVVATLLFSCPMLSRLLPRSVGLWFGRAQGIPACPHVVIVGPVDATRGIQGLAEMKMSRQRLLTILGKPLKKRVQRATAIWEGVIDPEDVNWDLFEGVFAWVRCADKDRVTGINFRLDEFRAEFDGSQKVLLLYKNHTYLLHQGLTLPQVIQLFRQTAGRNCARVHGNGLVLLDSGAYLEFNPDEHLSVVHISDYVYRK
jgi:hypothetical protein